MAASSRVPTDGWRSAADMPHYAGIPGIAPQGQTAPGWQLPGKPGQHDPRVSPQGVTLTFQRRGFWPDQASKPCTLGRYADTWARAAHTIIGASSRKRRCKASNSS
jgi:hypothetical protein